MNPNEKIPLERQLAWQRLRNQVDACRSLDQLREICHQVINHGIVQEAATEAICGWALVKQEPAPDAAFPAVPNSP